ncbi:MAG: pilus assembly protein TadE [Chloroflexota bacterium]
MQRSHFLFTTLDWVRRDESGIQSIEVLGFFPIVLLSMMIFWQIAAVGYTGVVAAGAAREGAVTAARGGNVDAAVRNASPGFDGRRWWRLLTPPCSTFSGAPVTVEVELEVPHVEFAFFGALDSYPHVKAQSTARCEIGFSFP